MARNRPENGRFGLFGCRGALGGVNTGGATKRNQIPHFRMVRGLRLGKLDRAATLAQKSVRFFKLSLSNALPLKVVSRVGEIENLQLTESGEGVL